MNKSIYDENGNVRIPCKPGDYVYQLDRMNKKILTKKSKNRKLLYITKSFFDTN